MDRRVDVERVVSSPPGQASLTNRAPSVQSAMNRAFLEGAKAGQAFRHDRD